ncbi:MAG TPA: type II toxin-antitoxin system Phd/YefM family antitoxin [Kiritimatiellia bacterium]|nr:type II toxin-antitoxin system Phd/YefM family antitoxin [Kiritimatiellia bacterium]HMP00696.1 type II toxin-antitoxin system Phd/YefM family antitoxin [Kiritimatiellia bacterium]HMP91096.1 type II toxin-antitoxin system Phd/YefM family antitoxin [Kiritimatiellia bacterium]
MNTMSIVEAREGLADAVNRVAYGGERVALARRGKPVAVLVSVEDLATLEALENQADLRDARNALKEHERNPAKSITLSAYKAKAARKA